MHVVMTIHVVNPRDLGLNQVHLLVGHGCLHLYGVYGTAVQLCNKGKGVECHLLCLVWDKMDIK